ncbi:hypothetical protein [Acrocarpospora sp. B8E8]|uniref:hypothetical protein n=1 Tax=Acrocarpospora sp. B8E8 TaxID=3153572 RepID=UPI00325FC37A
MYAMRWWQHWFGRRIRCTRCGARLDRGVPILRRVSPSRIVVHAFSCPAGATLGG